MPRVQLKLRPEEPKVKRVRVDLPTVDTNQAEFEPTDEQRELVEELRGMVLPEEDVRQFIKNPKTGKPIDLATLKKHFPEELEHGLLKMKVKLSRSHLRQALGTPAEFLRDDNGKIILHKKTGRPILIQPGVLPNLGAGIWYEKSRFGLKETTGIEHTGPGGAPLVGTTTIIVIPSNGRDQPLVLEQDPALAAKVVNPDESKV